MTHPEYEVLNQSGDFGPDTGHYHVFVEQDGYMVPWTGGYTDSLCWTTRTKVKEIADMLRDNEADRPLKQVRQILAAMPAGQPWLFALLIGRSALR